MGSNWANSIPITAFIYAPLDNYVCGNCGYVESYISNPAKLSRIAEKWPRHIPGGHEYGTFGPKTRFSGKTCPQCSRPIQPGWRACPHCGQMLV